MTSKLYGATIEKQMNDLAFAIPCYRAERDQFHLYWRLAGKSKTDRDSGIVSMSFTSTYNRSYRQGSESRRTTGSRTSQRCSPIARIIYYWLKREINQERMEWKRERFGNKIKGCITTMTEAEPKLRLAILRYDPGFTPAIR